MLFYHRQFANCFEKINNFTFGFFYSRMPQGKGLSEFTHIKLHYLFVSERIRVELVLIIY